MPGPYSKDLRRRVVAAVLERGERPEAVARRFEVGRSTVYRWVEAAREEGRFEAKPRRGGPEPVIRDGVEAALVRLVAADNDRTLAEYTDRLAAEAGVRVHPWTVGRALKRLGWTRKKEGPARRRAGPPRDRRSPAGLAGGAGGHRPGPAGVHR
jgi:transposase